MGQVLQNDGYLYMEINKALYKIIPNQIIREIGNVSSLDGVFRMSLSLY